VSARVARACAFTLIAWLLPSCAPPRPQPQVLRAPQPRPVAALAPRTLPAEQPQPAVAVVPAASLPADQPEFPLDTLPARTVPAEQPQSLTFGIQPPAPRAERPPPVSFKTQSWPRREVLDLAMQAYRCGQIEGHFPRSLLTVIDYSLPSSKRRLWVIDVETKRVLHHEYVAHGDNSGDALATAFSNRIGSHQSSLGLFRTDEVYVGQHGYSLRMSGLEPGVNDNARERAIVFHGAPYVDRETVVRYGRLGRSWGCPALSEQISARVIDDIRDGSAVFAYYPDAEWLSGSRFLHCGGQLADVSDVVGDVR
jgi:hypothetical protein